MKSKKKFINFRNVLRYQAGYPHPDGLYIWDMQFEEQSYDPDTIEEPRYIFDRLNECLLIANKHINDKLHNLLQTVRRVHLFPSVALL